MPSRFCKTAPITALPIAPPTCLTVFSTPDAAPAICGFTLRIATVVRGAKVMPSPNPASAAGPQKVAWVAFKEITITTSPIPAAKKVSPATRMYLPPNRSDIRPAMGATTIETSDIGRKVSPAFSAENPRTD